MSEFTAWTLIIGCGLIGFFSVKHLLTLPRRLSTGKNNTEQANGFSTNTATADEDTSPKTWYEVLEVAPEASVEEIRSAYTRLIKLYHPDRVHGLAPEYQRISQVKSKELNRAYTEAIRQRAK